MELYNSKNQKRWFWGLVFGLCFCLLAPFILTRSVLWNWDGFSDKTGVIGDTIGGIMGPFVAILSAILTFLAFWVQYKANEEQKKATERNEKEIIAQKKRSDRERFESRLETMMSVYQHNVENMSASGGAKGVWAFHRAIGDLHLMYYLVEIAMFEIVQEIDYNRTHSVNIEQIKKIFEIITQSDYELRKFMQRMAYMYFLYGLSYREDNQLYQGINTRIKRKIRGHINIEEYERDDYTSIEAVKIDDRQYHYRIKSSFKFEEGYSSVLSQYFRQLNSIFKSIDSCDPEILSDDEKQQNADLLQSQLSDGEQILLYYHSLSSLDSDIWLYPSIRTKEEIGELKNGLLTKYRIIRDLPVNFKLFGVRPEEAFKHEKDYYKTQNKKLFLFNVAGVHRNLKIRKNPKTKQPFFEWNPSFLSPLM